ncbi:MerR family transcriptional regulator [Pseudolabrys sp. Root1462]|uniref:MerR family transcriptional regulator n=1 Tax=Pseudolabrys sp. Root1462 TaxID=1736466 RepID=UPI0009E66C89|nr:MerR family transcriptional regulator [Pseudolabrys sp. Root1462]
MDNKAPDAFRTISEVADELDLPQHVLRFWESRFAEIKPMKRGGGRRFYRPDDIDLLRGIRHLLYGEGYTIRGVQRILREQGIDFVQSIWQEGAAPLPADDAEDDLEEAIEAEDEELEEPRGLRDRISSLIGRDLGDSGDVDNDRQEPPMQSAPMPRIDPGERIGTAPRPADRPTPLDIAPRTEPRTEPRAEPQPAPQAAASVAMPQDKLERLKSLLDELKECRSLIDAALAPASK